MSQLYGYIRTSRQQVGGVAGSDPLTQERQLAGAGVPSHLVFRDVGVSGRTGANTRTGWRALDARLGDGDTLVVASIDRIGRRWLNTLRTLCSLRDRGVRIRSLSSSEGPWVAYLDADPDAPEPSSATSSPPCSPGSPNRRRSPSAEGPSPAWTGPGPRGSAWALPGS